jgi:DeoR/GlpR family transcriptional regulator of sugar metabolism
VVGVADAYKWGNVATATFARLDEVDLLITDSDAAQDLVDQMRQRQVEVIVV